MSSQKSVLVTGANGYIGFAVARAFSTAGYRTYGLVRQPHYASSLAAAEITPIVGSAADLSFLPSLQTQSKTFDIIVSTTEDNSDYVNHFNATMSLFRQVAAVSSQNGLRPLVIFTSGCKDYGTTDLHGDVGLAPHTEASLLNPPWRLRLRAENATIVFEHTDLFDAVLMRPATLYGLSSSYYAVFFDLASRAAEEGKNGGSGILKFPADQRNIMHALHVDDLSAAYIAVAAAPRETVKGQMYNVSSHRYETLHEVAEALKYEYKGIKEVQYTPGGKYIDNAQGLFGDMVMAGTGFSQWVGSEKVREHTGWSDRKALFSEDVGVYRRAFEEAKEGGHEGLTRILGYPYSN